MQELPRRAVLIGVGVLAGVAAAPAMSATRAAADPSVQSETPDLALLRRTFVLADEARQGGGAPYGALVADADGKVIAEHRNSAWADGGDPTQHAELVATTDAWRALGSDGMNNATLYASTEPCSMCAGASYWNGIGRVASCCGVSGR